jgi:ABC-type transport system substrate-binding protein
VTGIELDAVLPHITLTRNERYWGGRAKLDGIAYMIMSYDEALEAYKRDELQILRPDFDRLAEFEADPVLGREMLKMPAPFVGIFNLNVSKAPFDDKQVREAFAYAFDRAAYCREMERDTCTSSLSWIPPPVPGAIETDAYAYDPERARETLAASTYGRPENLPEIVW